MFSLHHLLVFSVNALEKYQKAPVVNCMTDPRISKLFPRVKKSPLLPRFPFPSEIQTDDRKTQPNFYKQQSRKSVKNYYSISIVITHYNLCRTTEGTLQEIGPECK